MYYFMLYARIFCDSHLKDYSVNIKSLQAMLVLLFKANLPVKNISQPLKVVLYIISVMRVDVVYRSTEYLVTDSVIIVAKIYKSLNFNKL